ncbi:DUF4381 domain-containing protein [Photobacterium sp. DNB22_13_2]
MDNALNLAPLDIPTEPSWWPLPTSAWLTLGCIAMVVLIGLGVKLYRYAQGRIKRKALRHLLLLEQQPDLPALDILLRRVALTYFPRNEVAGLTGEAWLGWLDKQLDTPQFMPLKHHWSAGLYGNRPLYESHWVACISASRLWVTQLKPEGKC